MTRKRDDDLTLSDLLFLAFILPWVLLFGLILFPVYWIEERLHDD